jgi:hypothetical protein
MKFNGLVRLQAFIMRGLRVAGTAFLEQQQHLALFRPHRATAFARIADHFKTKDRLAKMNGFGNIANVQRGLQDSVCLRARLNTPSRCRFYRDFEIVVDRLDPTDIVPVFQAQHFDATGQSAIL